MPISFKRFTSSVTGFISATSSFNSDTPASRWPTRETSSSMRLWTAPGSQPTYLPIAGRFLHPAKGLLEPPHSLGEFAKLTTDGGIFSGEHRQPQALESSANCS
ncbi:hypothetical protein IB238_23840 [Rhizobium sp. ARZ01]|uniref:hypothetical protein n=1 Tax=Rhizobium sp. ARZ01 TaxID=2769313 RepID=UPI00177CB4D5|nr:hypothetical protein [Rhizobium sp. ARZ01]MBD9375643.1 hypothetical protein [Rhizobium sp. ARZ01]